MRASCRSPKSGYLVALVSTAVVVLLRLALADWLHDRIPLLLPLVVVVFLAAWCGGLKPGLLATALGMLVASMVLSSNQTNQVGFVMFLTEGLAISASFEAMHKARRRLERKQQQLEAEIRERQRVEQELVEADRRKDEFLATLAHELRNPLAPIRNCLEITRSNDNPSLREQTHHMMERQVQQMVRLVDDLLDVSRISRNKIVLRKERVPLARVIESAVETVQPLLQASGHQLAISSLPEPILVHADPIRLAQVLSNLLNNAAKYTKRGGQIWLTVERTETAVSVRVQDNGVGIPADMLSSIFEMFTQVEGTLELSHGGLGIGLSLVKWLTEMHDGRVEARSDGPGKGSEFIVHLPTLTVAEPPAVLAGSTQRPQSSAGRRVLVVDDNEDVVSSMRILLTSLGNEVQTAGDGLTAVEAAATFRPDMVMLDLRMPGMNGFEAARQIREQPWGKKMVLVAHTGWGQAEVRRRTREAGFDHHLVKPVARDALEEILVGLSAGPC